MSDRSKTENYRFFQHKECEFFPCHEGADEKTFNCLFCYCPLYLLKEDCGGDFEYMKENGIKDCTSCMIPHGPEGFDFIMNKWPDVAKAVSKPNDRLND